MWTFCIRGSLGSGVDSEVFLAQEVVSERWFAIKGMHLNNQEQIFSELQVLWHLSRHSKEEIVQKHFVHSYGVIIDEKLGKLFILMDPYLLTLHDVWLSIRNNGCSSWLTSAAITEPLDLDENIDSRTLPHFSVPITNPLPDYDTPFQYYYAQLTINTRLVLKPSILSSVCSLPKNLHQWVKKGIEEGVDVFGWKLCQQIRTALRFLATTGGFVHGDIKSRNILIDINTGTIRLIDFGHSHQNHLHTPLKPPAPEYAPWEYWSKEYPIRGPTMDSYATGALFMGFLVGTSPFTISSLGPYHLSETIEEKEKEAFQEVLSNQAATYLSSRLQTFIQTKDANVCAHFASWLATEEEERDSEDDEDEESSPKNYCMMEHEQEEQRYIRSIRGMLQIQETTNWPIVRNSIREEWYACCHPDPEKRLPIATLEEYQTNLKQRWKQIHLEMAQQKRNSNPFILEWLQNERQQYEDLNDIFHMDQHILFHSPSHKILEKGLFLENIEELVPIDLIKSFSLSFRTSTWYDEIDLDKAFLHLATLEAPNLQLPHSIEIPNSQMDVSLDDTHKEFPLQV